MQQKWEEISPKLEEFPSGVSHQFSLENKLCGKPLHVFSLLSVFIQQTVEFPHQCCVVKHLVLLQREDLDVELDKAAYYMQFAAAAYGWPLYVYSRPFTGLCKLCGEW